MCSTCSQYLIEYPKRHSYDECPLTKYQYCSFCARNGHTTTQCPYNEDIQPSRHCEAHFITEIILEHAEPCLKNPKLTRDQLKLWFIMFLERNSYIKQEPWFRTILQQGGVNTIPWDRITQEVVGHFMPYNLQRIYGDPEEEYLEVIDHEVNIRAVLIAFGIKLSGIKEINRERVELLSERLGCEIRWLEFARGEPMPKVDEKPSRSKKSKGKKQSQTPIESEDEDYEAS